MTAYYNEIDPFAADWLEELIKHGHIAPGVVDRRSIEDVTPADLAGFTQCHFFAGIGVWSYTLRRAGWPDERPVWTASCPCQPFSSAGKGGGFDDERHLWPALFHLIGKCRPGVVFGEQVASKDGLAWIDLVQTDLETAGYAVGALDLCAAGVGAPHIRQRLYWLGTREQSGLDDARRAGLEGQRGGYNATDRHGSGSVRPASATSEFGRMVNTDGGHAGAEWQQCSGEQRQQQEDCGRGVVASSGVAHTDGRQSEQSSRERARPRETACRWTHGQFDGRSEFLEKQSAPGPTNGEWGNADWLHCRDGRWRPVEPGTFPLVNGASARVGRLRGYGNAIVAPLAEAFITAYIETDGTIING